MTALYAFLVLLILAAFAGMFWLKREADKAWAQHVTMRALARDWDRFKVALGEQWLPAVRQMATAFEALAPKLQALGEAMRKAGVR